MFVENTVNAVEHTQPTGMNRGQKFAESFHDILRSKLKSKSNPRSQKLELSGILIPCHEEAEGRVFRFKLGTHTDEYLLSLNSNLGEAAKKAGWDEVTVRGFLDVETNIFDVEKLVLNEDEDLAQVPSGLREPVFEVDTYTRMINQRGKLEPALDCVAS